MKPALTLSPGFCSNRQVPEPEICAVADNLVEALRFFGRARSDAEIRDLAGASLIFCGLNYAAFNAALLTQPMEGEPEELASLIQVCSAPFAARKLRWTCWLCEDFLSKPLRERAPRIFDRAGLRPLTTAPGMYAETLRPARRALPDVEVRRVGDAKTCGDFAELMATAFDIPHSVSTSIYGAARAWSGGFRGYVGYSNGRPVTSAASMVTGDVVGLYSIATAPAHRRRGFAEAIMRQVIEQARANEGIQRTILQATTSGLSLYEEMGYRTVTNVDVYITG